ncbi:uncharacterized protein J4E84_009777 [Alternaria hordeiaustralica]|uniref:uncharacterized protein n=1 Tax=Alternaria hordeiaustralica TaxID=1187925 RepID=UPI0020C2EF04|nr:uncharacterized protein J4E84_009777 [Alternaria hordeiaustralica]KAI4675978.1 hypothetical protein J4E84_009777 [Alternaria hordeiaustralica]
MVYQQRGWLEEPATATLASFRDYITYDILANPALNAYLKTPAGRKILKEYLADFLFVRSKKLNGFARSHVTDFIRAILRAMTPWIANDTEEAALRRALCELFVRNHSDAFRCVTTDFNKLGYYMPNTIRVTDTALIAAAAATGKLNALKHFVGANKCLLWTQSLAFGYPLDAAVYAGQEVATKALVQQAITNQDRDVAGYQYSEHVSFRQAICTTIGLEDDSMTMTKYLLAKYITAFGSATEACMKAWLDKAIQTNKEELLKLLLALPSQTGPSTIYAAFETACRLSKPDLLHLLFGPQIGQTTLAINQIQGSTYALLTAVNLCTTPAAGIFIKSLLELGADPNGPAYRAGVERSLQAAMRYGRSIACLVLLEAGANPHLVTPGSLAWVESVKKRYREDTRAGRVFREALEVCEVPKVARDEDFLVEVDEVGGDVEVEGGEEVDVGDA